MSAISDVTPPHSPSAPIAERHQCIQTSSAEKVREILSQAQPGDLVVFDVDEVLLTLKDAFLRPCASEEMDPIFYDLFYPWSDPEKHALYGKWVEQVEVEPCNPIVNALVGEIQEKGIDTIGLTSVIPGSGPCGEIESMEGFRHAELSRSGVDFTCKYRDEAYPLPLPPINGQVPTWDQGCLFAIPYGKGDVLEAYLEKEGLTPQRIFFVDNSPRNVENVGSMARERGIPYVGVEYLDEKFGYESYDLELGKFQFQHFKETGIWLNDEQAQAAMNG